MQQYKKGQIIYMEAGSFEYVVEIGEVLEKENIFHIQNGIFRFSNKYEISEEYELPQIKEPELEPVIIRQWVPEPPQPINKSKYSVPEWLPVSLIYPHYEDKPNFHIERLEDITRFATEEEIDAYFAVVGYNSYWKDSI